MEKSLSAPFKAKVVEKIMVFKPHSELPSAFKYCKQYIPAGLANVVVLDTSTAHMVTYLHVRFGKDKVAVLNRDHFMTLGQKLIWLKRNKVKLPLAV